MPIYGQSCDSCGSSDAVTVYDDGHTTCFSCNHQTFDNSYKGNPMSNEEKKLKEMFTGGEYKALKGTDEFFNRGIDQDVCEKFGVKIVGGNKLVLPYYDKENNYKAQKARIKDVAPKGAWYGDASACKTLFGQQLWQQPYKKLLVTEGELDCLAAYQMFGKKYPVVSLRNGADTTGAGPLREFKENFEFFRLFDEIVLCFDNDPPGRTSAQKIADSMLLGKIKIMTMHKHKDANEYLLNNDREEFTKEFWNARAHVPQDIVFGTELRDRIIKKLNDRKERSKVRYPWEGLNGLTYGIRTGEMVTIISGSGLGKSSVIGELCYHILKKTDEKIGLFMLEESVEMANLRLASIHAGKPYHLPDTEWTEQEILQQLEETVELKDEEGNPRVVSFDHFGSNSIDELLFRVDHMVALGCKYIFLDHISIVVSDQSHGDERRALDEIATKLRTKIQEHDVALFVVSHVRRTNSKPHEEGGQTSLQDIRGTQAIAQLSDMVLGLERDGQAEDPVERNTTKLRVLKNRLAGLTGLAASLFYDKDTGRLNEINNKEESVEDSDSMRKSLMGPTFPAPKEKEEDGNSTVHTDSSISASSSSEISVGDVTTPTKLTEEFWEEGDDLPESFLAAG